MFIRISLKFRHTLVFRAGTSCMTDFTGPDLTSPVFIKVNDKSSTCTIVILPLFDERRPQWAGEKQKLAEGGVVGDINYQ